MLVFVGLRLGENVSTTEVETVISSLIELAECVCFGVEVPGHEGRACMVAVVQHPEHPLQLDDLLRRMKLNLPPYAIPVFIRLIHDAQYTATFKLQKVQLKQQAYDSDLIKDPVFMLNENRTNYDRIDSKLMANIRNSNVRL